MELDGDGGERSWDCGGWERKSFNLMGFSLPKYEAKDLNSYFDIQELLTNCKDRVFSLEHRI